MLEDVDQLQLKKDFWFLISPFLVKSTNNLRNINGSGAWLLYFSEPASAKVQMIYEVATVLALTICTMTNSALLHWTNASVHPYNSDIGNTLATPNLQTPATNAWYNEAVATKGE